MWRALKWPGLVLLAVLAAGAALLVNIWYFKPISLDAFYARAFLQFGIERPQMLSDLRWLPPPFDFYSDRLDDLSPEQDRRDQERVRNASEMLLRYDRSRLDAEDRISYDTFEYFLRMKREGERFSAHVLPLTQLFGPQNELPRFMTATHAVTSVRDGENYVARLNAFPRAFDGLIESLRLREKQDLLPPNLVVSKVVRQINAFVAQGYTDNPLYVTLKEKLDKAPAGRIDDAARKRLLAETELALRRSVYPSFRRLHEYLIMLGIKAQSNDGVWRLHEGDAYYAWCVRDSTTTNLTPQQVHDLGLAEVARVGGEVDAKLKSLGMSDGSVGARLRQLGEDPAQTYPNTPEGKRAILAQFQAILDDASGGLGTAFGRRPRAGIEVRPVPEQAQDAASAAFYTAGSIDGSRPGIFYTNLRDTKALPKFEMRTTAFHEGIPGHHFQISIARELQHLPLFRKIVPFTAYSEGWGLYAERLGAELGLERDPLDSVGRLRWEMLRAVRLVVDTGIHFKRWTHNQAIAYMIENTGKDQASASAEVERYIVYPGQAVSYMVGMLKIVELREKARAALGPKFDLAQFHDEVLTHGPVPIVVLERIIDDWIKRKA